MREDDLVIIRNCRPISAMKRFALEKILKSPQTDRDISRAQRAEEAANATSPKSGNVLQALRMNEVTTP